MMVPAPARRASSAFWSPLTVVITVAPAQRASWMAAWPTAPAPPVTRTVRPARAPAESLAGPSSFDVRARCAVNAGIPNEAPVSKDSVSGRGTALLPGTTTYSCAVPSLLPQATSHSQTRPPTERPVTPGPSASMTPAPSWFGTLGASSFLLPFPDRDFQSVGLTPDTTTRTRTSPGPGTGSGLSVSFSTDEGPVSS